MIFGNNNDMMKCCGINPNCSCGKCFGNNKQVKLNLLCIDYFNALNDKTINLSKHKIKKEFNAILEDMEKERLREIRRVDDRLIKMMQDLTNDY